MFARLLGFALAFAATALSAAPAASATTISPEWRRPPPLMTSPGAETLIQLQSLSVKSEISGSVAETTVRMVFFNPNSRQLEGNLQFPLLNGQQITAFALDIDGRMRPAVPVDKARGREIFEAIQRRKIDPGLLEVTQGNNFKLRVYPIFARNTRTVEIKYSEALVRDGKDWIYRLPLAYGDRLKDFDLTITANGATSAPVVGGMLDKLNFHRQGDGFQANLKQTSFVAPTGILMLRVPAKAQAQSYVQQREGERYFLAEVPVPVRHAVRQLPKTVGLLWDSSGSGGARQIDAELAELDRYFRAVGNAEVRLTRLRDRPEMPESFRVVKGNWDTLRQALQTTVYDGASALSDWRPQDDVDEYLLVSDGLQNYGPSRFPVLNSKQRLYAMSSSLSADFGRLSALAERYGGQAVQVRSDKPGLASQMLLRDVIQIHNIRASGASEVQIDASSANNGLLRLAGKLTGSNAQLTLTLLQDGRARDINIAVPANAPPHPLAAYLWASYKLHGLEADFEFNRAAIRRIGMQFAIPTRETSLLVLERLDDYVRYDVTPPAELLPAFEAMKSTRWQETRLRRDQHLEQIVREFQQKVAWWEKGYPQNGPKKKSRPEESEYQPLMKGDISARAMAAPAASPRAMMESSGAAADNFKQEAKSAIGNAEQDGRIGFALKRWTPDAPYIARMQSADTASLYRIYLDEKPAYANSSAFFLDAADMLLDKGQREPALRVLSNLAEMDLENRHVLRILGYRLLQAGAPELAVPVFEKVKLLAEEEPQSFRDLGLAYAAAKQYQPAIDNLNEVVVRPWDWRFAEVGLIALAELNDVVVKAKDAGVQVDTSRIDPRLLRNLPLDLRAVLTWDADNSDMDLWVTDPDGERCYFGNRLTYQGGRMSRDFTGGYGPEEFSLRKAKPGKYKIEASFFGSTQQIVTGATTLQLKVSSDFGMPQSKEQMVTLRLNGRGNTIFVGEFEVKPK